MLFRSFIDVHAHGQTADTYRFQSLDGVTTTLELELGTADVDGWYKERERGQRINYGVSVGHIKVRMAVKRERNSAPDPVVRTCLPTPFT